MEKVKGILIKGVGGLYEILPADSEKETVLSRARGIFRLEGVSPLAGDDVLISPANSIEEEVLNKEERDAGWVITDIQPRKNDMIRPPMANLTHLFVVVPCASPKPDLLMADKLTCIAVHKNITPVFVINKMDMDPEMNERICHMYALAGFPAFPLSAATGEGVDALEAYLQTEAEKAQKAGSPMRAAFAGVSGAGKSTLMTRLYPDLQLKTNTVSAKIERGRHTTRHVELYPVKAGEHTYFLADTPGFSMLDFTRFNFLTAEELPESFPEFADCIGDCRYTKCTHTREEGCAVLEKVRRGKMEESRHQNYITIREEILKKPEWKRQKEAEGKTPGKRRR